MQWLRNLPMFARTLLIAITTLAVLLTGLGLFSMQLLQDSTERMLAERLNLARLVAAHIDDHIVATIASLEHAALPEDFDLTDTDWRPERRALRGLGRAGVFSCHVFIADSHGIVILTEPAIPEYVGTDRSSQPHIAAALQTGQPQVSNNFTCPDEVPTNIGFAVPIKDRTGTVVGLLGGVTDPASPSFAGMLEGSPTVEAGHMDIVDANGIVLASTNPSSLAQESHHRGIPDLIKAGTATTQRDSLVTVGNLLETSIVTYAPLKNAPWGVVIAQPEHVLLAPVNALRGQLIVIGIVLVALAMVAIVLTRHATALPLRRLLDATRRVGAGDLRTPIAVNGRDEIAELARGFEEMRQKLARWGEEMETAVQKRTRELSTLYTIDRAAAQSFDLHEILDESLRKVLEVLEVEAGLIFLLESDGETLSLGVSHGVSDDFVRNLQRIKLGEGVSGRAAAEQKPVVLDVLDYPTERLAPYINAEGLQTLASTPLLSGGQLVGALTLAARHPHRFLPEELDLLTAIGRQLGGAVQNARLYRETMQRSQQFALLCAAGLTINCVLDPRTQMEALFKIALQALQADRVEFFRYDAARDEVYFEFSTGYAETAQAALRDLRFRLGEERGLVGWVSKSCQPLYLPDVSADSRWVRIDPEIRSALWVPVLHETELRGALAVMSTRLDAFSPQDKRLLGLFANQVSVAMENARLYAREKQLAHYLRSLNQAMVRAAAGLNIETVVQTVAQCLVEECDATFARVWLTDESGEYLILRASAGLYTHLDGSRARISIADDSHKLGIVARERQPLITNQVQREPYFDSAWAEREGIVAFAGYPIVANEELLGVIALFSRQPLAPEMLDVLGTFVNQVAVALTNVRLYDAERRRTARLAALQKLGIELATLHEESTILNTLIKRVADLAESATCTVMLVDEARSEAVLAAQTGLPEDTRTLRVPLTLPIIRHSLETGEPILVPNIDRDAPALRAVLVRKDIRSFFAYPMLRQGRALGYITLSTLTPRTPSDSEISAYRLLADRAAAALENARLFKALERELDERERVDAALQRRLADLSALFTVSSALREAKRLNDMLPIILDKTVEVLQADSGALFCLDEKIHALVAQVTRGKLAGMRGLKLGLGEGLCGYVAQTCAPYPFADLAADPHTGARVQPFVKGVQGGVCVPLLAGEQLVGTLIVGSDNPRRFTDDEVRLLTAIGDMASSAIKRTSLFEELEHRVHELSVLFDVGKMVTASLRVEDMVEFVMNAVTKTVRAEGGALFLWDEGEERLVMRAVVGAPPALVGHVKYRSGEGLAGWVLLERRPANVSNAADDPRWKLEPEQESALSSGRINCVLIVPLIAGENVLGTLSVANKIGAPGFTESDESLLTTLAGQIAIAIENAGLYEDVRDLSVATIRSLATAIDARDPYTRGHSEGVARMAVQLARELGWSSADLEMLEFAGLLHDVGKIAVPDAILRKAEPLTPAEWEIIRLHPYHSAQIVKPVEPLKRIVPWVYHHQERWDGSGYPDGLKGEDIPLAARIIAVADAFNAMTTDRPYRKALSVGQAVAEIKRCASSQFDPAVVDVFIRKMEK